MAEANVPLTVSFPLGTPRELLAKVDEAMARYFNLQVSLPGGWGPETTIEREEIAAYVVAHLLGWDRAAFIASRNAAPR